MSLQTLVTYYLVLYLCIKFVNLLNFAWPDTNTQKDKTKSWKDLGKHLRIKKRHRPKKNRRDKINNTNQIHLNKGKKSVEDPKNKKIFLQIF